MPEFCLWAHTVPHPCLVPGLIEYITSGPVVAIALEGKDVVVQVRVGAGLGVG